MHSAIWNLGESFMKCSKCGNENREGVKFCDNCGANLNEGTTEPNYYQERQQQYAYQILKEEQKSKKKNKKYLVVIIVVLVLIVFSRLVSPSSSGDTKGENSTEIKHSDTTDTINSAENGNNVGDYIVKVRDTRTAKQDDETILIVDYDFTNNSDKAISFSNAIGEKAYQNGIELGTVWSSYGIDNLDFDLKGRNVKPGNTFTVQCAYELNDTSSDVELEFTNTIWSDKVQYEYTVKL